MKKTNLYALCAGFKALMFLSLAWPTLAQQIVVVDANARAQHQISDHVVGLHFVYSNDRDAAYSNGEFASWAKSNRVGYARFPGGTVVKYWDWQRPTGILTSDNWEDNCRFDPSIPREQGSQWMSLDEFITFVRDSGVKPTFGVNTMSGERGNCRQKGIDRAVAMVRYVRNQGFGGGDWYIGNEEDGNPSVYAERFRDYARAIKAEDPDIKVFFNMNNPSPKRFNAFLANDGGTADGIETHGKWPFGGSADFPGGTLAQWRTEFPLRDRKNRNRAWREEANYLRAAAKNAPRGARDILVSNNEYGFGKGINVQGFDRYQRGLLMTDFLSELVIGDYYSTAFWSNILNPQSGNYWDEISLLSADNDYRRNPFTIGMELLREASGADFLKHWQKSDSFYGFIVRGENKSRRYISWYILNKSTRPRPIQLSLNNLPQIDNRYAFAMVRCCQGFGTKERVSISEVNGRYQVTAPAESFTRVTFVDRK